MRDGAISERGITLGRTEAEAVFRVLESDVTHRALRGVRLAEVEGYDRLASFVGRPSAREHYDYVRMRCEEGSYDED